MSGPDHGTADEADAYDRRQTPPRRRSRALLGVGAVVLVGIVAAALAWLLIVRPNDDEPNAAPPVAEIAVPAIASLADLRRLADSGETFYWAGVQDGARIELTTPGGTVYLRYLPSGERAGSIAPALTVATYPRSNGFDEVQRAGKGANVTELKLARGGLAVVDAADTNVHLAYPDQPYQVEVYSPEPGVARRLVAAGTIRAYS